MNTPPPDTTLPQPLDTPALPTSARRSFASCLLLTLGGVIIILLAAFILLMAVPVKSENPGGALHFIAQVRNFIFSGDRALKGQTDDRINILLLGIGGEGHDGPYLTDTIMLASIKPSTKQIALISIPRDLIIPIPGGYGYRKINSADAYGEEQQKGNGAAFAAQVVSQIFNIPIHYYVRADFTAFKEIIDRVGGVDVYVDRDFTDYEFPTDDFKYRTVSFKKGLQTMNGQTALDFARSRHGGNGEGSDFARARRQQKIILALKNKVLSLNTLLNPNKVNDIAQSLQRNISTDMEWWEMADFYKLAKTLDYETITMRVISAEDNGPLVESMLGDAAVLQARDNSFGELRRIVYNIFDDHASSPAAPAGSAATPESQPTVFIQNGTWTLGLAAEYKAHLESASVAIAGAGNAVVRDHQKTTVYGSDSPQATAIQHALEKLTGAPVERITGRVPDNLFLPSAAHTDLLIILGTDSDRLLSP